jgi:hypothetical protein
MLVPSPLEPRDATILRLPLGNRSTPAKQSGKKPAPVRGRGLISDQPHVFKLVHEIGNVREQLCARQAKFFFESVRNFIYGAPIFDHLPDPGSNRVQAETKTLLDIEQHGPVLIDGLSYSLRYFDRGIVHLFEQLLLLWMASLWLLPLLINCCGCRRGTHSSKSFPSRPFKLPGGPRFETKHAVGSVWPRLVLLPWKLQRKGSGFFLESSELTLERDSSRIPTGQQGAH